MAEPAPIEPQRQAPAAAHIEQIDQKLAELQGIRATLAHLVHCCHGDDRTDCPIIETLEAGRPASVPHG